MPYLSASEVVFHEEALYDAIYLYCIFHACTICGKNVKKCQVRPIADMNVSSLYAVV